jgi:hypothetical protein
MILQASLSKNTNATGLFPELIAMSHFQYLSGVLSSYETGDMVLHAVASGAIDPSTIRRLQNAPMDGVPRQKFLLINTSSLLNAERNDAGTGLDSGGATILIRLGGSSPTISSVAAELPTTHHPSVFGFQLDSRQLAVCE